MITCRIAMRVADARRCGLQPLADKLYETEGLQPETWHPDAAKTFNELLDTSSGYPAVLKSPRTGKPLVLTANTETELLNVLNHPGRENPLSKGGRPRKTSGKCTVRQAMVVINEMLDLIHSLNATPPVRALKFLESARYDAHVSETGGLAKVGRPGSTSDTPGVCFVTRSAKWRATLGTEYLGSFDTEVEAIEARKKAFKERKARETNLTDSLTHVKL